MKTRKWIPVALAALLVVVLAYLYARRWSNRNPDLIRVSGNIEVTEAEVSFKIPGRVQERFVTEGEKVAAGQIVARLESADLAQDVALRKAELQAAEAALAELQAGSRPQEIAVAEATVAAAKAEADNAKLEYDRQANLYKGGAVALREYDAATRLSDVARARLREAEERLKLVKEGPRQETIEQARARVKQAEAALELAETRLRYATLASPLSGVVLSKNIEPGEYVAPGTPIITVGDLVNVWLRAYISETDCGRVKLGQPVDVKTDSYPGKVYEGRVSFIASDAEFTPKNVQTEKERVKLVYRAKIDIVNPDMELKPGMPADAEILLGDRRAAQ